ncbi:Ribosomal protein L10 family protein [Perilla frutescens var. hirtella]|nr:Ribosomal protein L10 family protein [Perilla frutescens var. frutescens]KAH6794984.1 Ribosomal protein L10 family protein [Perilla frutescens var. hirtella]
MLPEAVPDLSCLYHSTPLHTRNKAILNLIPLVENVGLIFTKGDLKEVSEEVEKYKVT